MEWIELNTAADLRQFRTNKDGYYKLTRDIDLGGAVWNPACTGVGPFLGVLDGNGYRISNFVLSYPTMTDGKMGLLGANQGTIRNLHLTDVTIRTNEQTNAVGAFTAENFGTIENCRVAGTLEAAEGAITCGGAICGKNNGKIINCTSDLKITWNVPGAAVGGIAGQSYGGEITECYVNSHMEICQEATAGLLVGKVEYTPVRECRVLGMGKQGDGNISALVGHIQKSQCTGCRVRDWQVNDDNITPESMALREKAVAHMYKMGTVAWTPDVQLFFANMYKQSAATQTFRAGRTHYGMPYTNKYGSLERFMYCFEPDGTLKSFIKEMPNGAEGFDLYMGNDCSGAVYQAWLRIGCSFSFKACFDARPNSTGGTLPVGDYIWEGNEHTNQICLRNGEQRMAESYAKLRKGDAVVVYENVLGGHHIRMVDSCPVVVRSQDGTIDMGSSYITVHEQGGNLGSNKDHPSWESSWLIHHKWTFRKLWETYYVPITIQELQTGVMPERILEDGVTGLNAGTVSSNYRILSTRAVVEDAAGTEVWSDLKFTAVAHFEEETCDDAARSTIRSVNLADHAESWTPAVLETGKQYNYFVEVLLGTGETLTTRKLKI